MASTAAVLFVQNDADDIGWWMAYHLALGFDALIIIDDQSTDGTWEIIQSAAGLYPIEAQRAPAGSGIDYAERRSAAFSQAIASCRSRFDWVICLESDEYVYPEREDTIGAYLDRFADADAIMLHWSIFGSNNHIARTAQAPVAAYTRRAPLDFADHALGKRFVRPEAVQNHALDGCHYALDESRHVTASGAPYDPAAAPAWDGARILHYVARNMTHYTRRIARLPADVTPPDLWSHFNRNDEEDLAPSRFLPATRDHAARIARAGLDAFFWRVRQDIEAFSPSFLPETVFTIRKHESIATAPRFNYAQIENSAGERLAYDTDKNNLVFVSSDASPETTLPVWLVIDEKADPETPSKGFLMPPQGDAPPIATGALLTRWLPVQVDGNVSANSERTPCRLLALQGSSGFGPDLDGVLGVNAVAPMPLVLQSVQPDRALTEMLRPYFALRSRGDSLRDFVTGLDLMRTPHADALACAIAHLTPDARSMLEIRYAGLVPLWLAAA